jgi:hypothetical protein
MPIKQGFLRRIGLLLPKEKIWPIRVIEGERLTSLSPSVSTFEGDTHENC